MSWLTYPRSDGTMSAVVSPSSQVVVAVTPVADRLDRLEALVSDGARDPAVVAAARSIQAIRPSDPVQAVMDWQSARVAYRADETPEGGETYLSAGEVLRRGAGDCKQKSVLTAAILRALGYRSRAVWLDQERWARSNHVAVEACLPGGRPRAGGQPYAVQVYTPERGPTCEPGGWVWVETTLPGARVGEHPYAVLARLRPARNTGIYHPGSAVRSAAYPVKGSPAMRHPFPPSTRHVARDAYPPPAPPTPTPAVPDAMLAMAGRNIAATATPAQPAATGSTPAGCGYLSDADAATAGVSPSVQVCDGQSLPGGFRVHRGADGSLSLVTVSPHSPPPPAQDTTTGSGLGWWALAGAVVLGGLYLAADD